MFIKKDLRKIPKILQDAVAVEQPEDYYDSATEDATQQAAKKVKRTQALKELKLARRQQEFQGSVSILCGQPRSLLLPKLALLESLNLYDCGISNLDGIGVLGKGACPHLAVVNLGRNPIPSLPDEFGTLQSIQELWLDDCQALAGQPVPQCLGRLVNLTSLRASHCGFTELPDTVVQGWSNLELLCLDRNQLTQLPSNMSGALKNLRQLLLRHNPLTALDDDLFADMPRLQLLHLSSCPQLTQLPTSLLQCTNLTHLWANHCALTELIPHGDWEDTFVHLERLVLSHNPITFASVPASFWNRFGNPNLETGIITTTCNDNGNDSSSTCQVLLQGTPVLKELSSQEQQLQLQDDEEEEQDTSFEQMDASMDVDNE